MRRSRLLLALAALLFAGLAAGDTLESALSPGKLIAGHADLEGECSECHVPFRKSAQTGLCLDCHEDVARDVQARRGFHGRLEDKECRACHTEHKGRDMNIAPLDARAFDHRLTDFPLRGAHADPALECRDCHRKGRKFRAAPSTCVACHRKDDAHKGRLGSRCADCHVESDWNKTRFDHGKTRFPLTGKHRDVGCRDCHRDPGFKGAPTQCVACHRKDDAHKGRFGAKCASCHTDRDWSVIRFDHDRQTRFRLKGKHRLAKCESCHTGFLFKQKTPTACIACHRKDDAHKGQEGKRCESCHNERSWKDTLFDHGLTRFPLLGAHARAKCTDCHRTPAFKDADTACIACHRGDDKHRLRLGPRCESCHNTRSWKAWTFDHDRQTSFRLDGAHEGLRCDACHTRPMPKRVVAATSCVGCHEVDDVHDGAFGRQCGKCHVTSSFKTIRRGVGVVPRR